MPRAFASPSESGNSVSTSPWISSVGALILSSTVAGLDFRSTARVAASGVPVVASWRYAWQTSAAKRPQAGSIAPAPSPSPPTAPAAAPPTAPPAAPPPAPAPPGGAPATPPPPGPPAPHRGLAGRRAVAEVEARPALLEDTGRGGEGGLRQEDLGQVVPGDRGDDRVAPRILPGEQQGQAAAVRATDHADSRVAGRVQPHLGAGGQPGEQPPGVAHLVVGAVQVDLAAAAAEALGGPGEHRIAPVGERLGVGADRILRAAEAVREQHRGHPAGAVARQIETGIELDRLVAGRAGTH